MKKRILFKVVVGFLAVAMLSGCIDVNINLPQNSQGGNGAVQNSQMQPAPEISPEPGAAQPSPSTDVQSSATSGIGIEGVENELREMERLDEQLEDTLEFVLKGKDLKINEQVYFESKDKTIYRAGGSGESTRSLALLKEIYPDLQIQEKILNYTFDEAEFHVSDNIQYKKVDAVPAGKKLGEVYTIELKKANITSGSFDYKNIQEDFEVSFYLNDSSRLKSFDDVKEAKEAIKEYKVYKDGQDDYMLRWSNDRYTFFVEVDSQKALEDLVNANISSQFKM